MSAPTDVDAHVTYLIQRQLSSGGMSEVYEAVQLGVNDFRKRVALKLLHPKIAQDVLKRQGSTQTAPAHPKDRQPSPARRRASRD